MELSPGGAFAWIFVGIVAGWAAGKVSRGHGFGLFGDIVIGLTGALIGRLVAGMFVSGGISFLGSILVAFIGAAILLGALRAIWRQSNLDLKEVR